MRDMVVQSELREENLQGQDANDKRQRLRQRFEVIKKLGQGTYGKVQLAINKETKGEVAIKTIKKAKIENEQDLVRIRREIQIMASIQHPHIIHIYEVFENSEKIVLVMQYASGGELYDYLGCHRKLPEKEARRIFRQIAAAIYYCHKNKICHRDLKLENILLDDKGNAKIADFGLSNLFDERKKLRTFCGSPLYASPEIVKGTPYCGPEVDCWSLGVLLYTLVYGAMPFDGRNFKRLVKQISEGDYYEPSMKSKASGIIRRLLTVDVNCRATIKDICLDEWVNDGYDHSLFKLANDMADLTPVTISSSYAFQSATANPKDATVQTVTPPIKNHYQNGATAYATFKRNDDFGKNKHSLLNSSSILSSKIKNSPNEFLREENAVPCEIKFVMGNILTTVEKMVQRSNLISSNKVTKNIESHAVDKANAPLIVSNGELSELETNGTQETIVNGFPLISDVEAFTKNEDGNKKTDFSANKEKYKPDEKEETNDSKNVSEGILKKEMTENKTRENRKEQIKTWNVSIDQTQLTQKETDSILPIFDVTSVIPKRPNRRSSKGLQEQLIQNGGDIKKTVEKAIPADSSNDADSRNHPKSNDDKMPEKSTQCVGISGKTEKSETVLSSLSKHRNDVIDYINNIFSRHKLSTQIVRHTEVETKENKSEEKEKQLENSSSSNNKSAAINENIAQQVSNTETNEPKVESNSNINTANLISETLKTETSKLSGTDAELGETTENLKKRGNAHVNEAPLQNDTDGTKENVKQDTCDEFNNSSHVCEKIPNAKSKEVNALTETLSSKDKRSSKNKSAEDHGHHLATKNLKQRSTPNLVESETESYSRNRRISLRDAAKTCNPNSENTKSRQVSNKKRLKNRSYSVGNDEKLNDLGQILRRPRKYSLCALLAASFEFEQMAARQPRKDSDTLKKVPGKVEIPKNFDPSSESESQTPIDKREFILFPSISVAENKQKMENEIEKVKLSALSMMRRKSEACSRRRMKKYTRSCTDILQRMEGMDENVLNLLQNCSQYELEQLNGSADYIENENFNFGNELNFSADQWAAENFDSSQPLLVQGNESYVPISRCCKKINFPPKPQQNAENTNEAEEKENEVFTLNSYNAYNENMNGIDGNLEYCCSPNSSSKKSRKKNFSQHSVNDRNKRENKSKQSDEINTEEDEDNKSTEQSESMYSSSLDKDSSDNDDDLDEIFGTKLDTEGSENLWEFLKSVNADISSHLKRIKHNKSLCSRSKSQECKTSEDYKTYEKLLTRSLSKEEKQNSQCIRPGAPESLGDSCYCSLGSDFNQAHNSCIHMDKEQSDFSLSMKNSQSLDEEFGSIDKDLHCDVHPQFSGSLKEKYYSLSNLEDPRSFLYPQNFQGHCRSKKCRSWATVPDIDDYAEFIQTDGNMSPSTMRRLAIYNTMRPKQFQKSKLSQSQAMLNGDNNVRQSEKETSFKSNRKVFYPDKEHSSTLNKAMSEFNISSKELPYDLGSLNNLINCDINSRNSQRFCKSLGSKLDLESLNYSSDILSKKTHKSKESCLKKRERKVSFLDVSKSKNPNFGLESVAKAQKVLNSIDREVDTSIPEETGTLLEALKTQGYKTLISQRLQESEASEGPVNRRYSWACMRNIANMFPDSLSAIVSGKANINLEDYARYLLWNRKTFDDINYGSETLDDDEAIYGDTNMLNYMYGSPNYQSTDASWRMPPNTWLYQNLNNFRSSHNATDEFTPQDWDSSLPYPTYSELRDYDLPEFNSDRHLNLQSGKFSKTKYKTSLEHDQYATTFKEAGLQTKAPSTIEKLSKKIKALKSRCNQKSFDDSNNTKDQLSESVVIKESESNRFSSPPDPTDNSDDSESVSDRIWRKSFYSRFNDIPTLRRRRSTLTESDFLADSFSTKIPKHRIGEEHLTDGLMLKRKEPTSLPSTEKIDRKFVNDGEKRINNEGLLVKENDQHIPHCSTSKEQIDQIEDR